MSHNEGPKVNRFLRSHVSELLIMPFVCTFHGSWGTS
jgi:hypothetical protein